MGVLGWVSKVWRATDPVEGAKGVDHLFTTVTTVQRFNGGLVSYRELEDSKNALNWILICPILSCVQICFSTRREEQVRAYTYDHIGLHRLTRFKATCEITFRSTSNSNLKTTSKQPIDHTPPSSSIDSLLYQFTSTVMSGILYHCFHIDNAISLGYRDYCTLSFFLPRRMSFRSHNPFEHLLQLGSHEHGILLMNEVTAAGSNYNAATSIGIGQTEQAFIVVIPAAVTRMLPRCASQA